MSSLHSPRSHPPTQFFSADDILRASLASDHRDTRYSDRDTMYSNRNRDTAYSNRDSVVTTYTRASIATRASVATTAYRSTAIIAAAPVPVAVRAQAKIVTFGKSSAPSSPIPAVPTLTAEKVAEAERTRAANTGTPVPAGSRAASPLLASVTESPQESAKSPIPAPAPSKKEANAGLGLNIPIAIHAGPEGSKRASSIVGEIIPSHFDDLPESPILGGAESLATTPEPLPTQDLPIMLAPISPTESTMPDHVRNSRAPSQLVNSAPMTSTEQRA